MITVKIYEKFLELFDYQFPDEKRVLELLDNPKMQELLTMLTGRADFSRTGKLIVIKKAVVDVNKELSTISRMRDKLIIPASESSLPKITFNVKFKLDELISLRRLRKTLDDAGFIDENGRSMYFEMPLSSAFYIYFKTLTTT